MSVCDSCGFDTGDSNFCTECGEAHHVETTPGMRPESQVDLVKMVDPIAARIGTTVGGKYEITKLIGHGGYGAVYLAQHLDLGEPVAIKVMHEEYARQTEYRARFRREAVALARLKHPGIVTVHDFGEDNGELYIATEYLEGESLTSNLLVDGELLSKERILVIFEQLLNVLSAAHELGIIHRDMKPDNVMLLDGEVPDRVKVLDFGIALMDDRPDDARLTSTTSVQGTPLYMSPEQCRGRDVGPATDVYAVGAMLYQALAGIPPFIAASTTDLLVKHMFNSPAPIAEHSLSDSNPPAELEAVAQWALSKEASERPTVEGMLQALRFAAGGVDQVSVGKRDQKARVDAGRLDRSARALDRHISTQAVTVPATPLARPKGDNPQVAMWAFGRERANDLQAALAVNGVAAVSWNEAEPPPQEIYGRPVLSIVLENNASTGAMTRALSSLPDSERRPVIVIDVAESDEIPALIRAGASDVALRETGDDVISRRVVRLIKRGR